jgi:tetratricopeptide (TPR) repeat protein
VAVGDSSDYHMARATAFINEGDLSAATIELKSALQKDPNDAEARLQMGAVYLALDRWITLRKNFDAQQHWGRTLAKPHPRWPGLGTARQIPGDPRPGRVRPGANGAGDTVSHKSPG